MPRPLAGAPPGLAQVQHQVLGRHEQRRLAIEQRRSLLAPTATVAALPPTRLISDAASPATTTFLARGCGCHRLDRRARRCERGAEARSDDLAAARQHARNRRVVRRSQLRHGARRARIISSIRPAAAAATSAAAFGAAAAATGRRCAPVLTQLHALLLQLALSGLRVLESQPRRTHLELGHGVRRVAQRVYHRW